ncbi:cysteine--tRNA ligase, mitochondrial [Asbolus verrucosus]|uniref:Cysteine--tRNA ligase n=1 Tax=Asbolus verrucosus TaxID=1661398 RepID=A0A482W0H3_ASBVE|nr:cysteine--tRNA ligase, mitochondrial [Asbolus verrucosus]
MFLKRKCITSILKRRNHGWIKPEGYDTGIKVFNCVTRDKQPLIVKNKNLVSWYTCGPTVYDSAHIGHASCFLKLDVIQRILKEYFNLNIVSVMNITDVDDKIIAKSNELKISVQDVAKQFEKEFWQDLDSLNINKPDCVLRVTENMEIIKEFIRKLMDDQKAYKATDNSVYFDVHAYESYGKLQKISEESLEPVHFKKSNMDFALWKASKPNEIFWESSWGTGRPGWHIECSALASHVFGSEIDIHAGGIDLRFPHHENEEAQSCCAHGKTQWVNYWLHTGHLHLKGCEKMSKSLKNTLSISSMLQNTSAQVFRMACVMSHYRSSMEFSPEFMTTANNLLTSYINFFDTCRNYSDGYIKANINNDVVNKLITDTSDKIYQALTDDFNTPLVLKALSEVVTTINSMLHSTQSDDGARSVSIITISNLVVKTLSIFGININKRDVNASENNFIEVMDILNSFRQEIRQLGISKRDQDILKLCDNVRDNLKKCGIIVKDHGKLSSWSL